MTPLLRSGLTSAAALLLGLAVVASATPPNPAQKGSGKGSPDKTFMVKAAAGGIAEVKLGELATKKGSNPAVKQFGQKMVDDHGKANDELKSLASSKGVTLPSDTDAKHKAVMAKLSRLNGAAFDRAYVSDMVKDHEEDVAEFKKEAAKGKDSDAKTWAGGKVPTLEMHLQMARDASKALSSKSAAGKKMKMKM